MAASLDILGFERLDLRLNVEFRVYKGLVIVSQGGQSWLNPYCTSKTPAKYETGESQNREFFTFLLITSVDVIIRIATKTKWPRHWIYYSSNAYISA